MIFILNLVEAILFNDNNNKNKILNILKAHAKKLYFIVYDECKIA